MSECCRASKWPHTNSEEMLRAREKESVFGSDEEREREVALGRDCKKSQIQAISFMATRYIFLCISMFYCRAFVPIITHCFILQYENDNFLPRLSLSEETKDRSGAQGDILKQSHVTRMNFPSTQIQIPKI